MNTLVRSATTSLSRRLNGYEALDHYYDAFNRPENLGGRTPASKPRNVHASTTHPAGMASLGYRIAKAKQRQIFLQSYKLASRSKLRRSRSGKLKKVVVKCYISLSHRSVRTDIPTHLSLSDGHLISLRRAC
ncbi:hypothetical protein MANES_12G084600v8 [Manihot esculenta]|uniref:Uncharacterized protein n=1 Tax=Manihot esculenta TaxID=3983 RepID=A0A2C9UVT7_MANES|nr:hypothetical protein MANES_12G084600v8 [Manihot esculenta]